ncbi:MAG: polyprenyl synthetase family protein [Rhodospirillales bacterium]|nr:MAG: polyprenyl synthetase family protein [Rhodospirillales bacterium]
MAVVLPFDEKRKKAPSLDPLVALCAADLERVNAMIGARMQSSVALVPKLADHLVGAGGKRMRPMLTVAAAKLCGYRGEHHVQLAACVEFIHSATLLHDDVVDGSDLRRGQPAAHALWGNKASVLVGDFLFTRAFELMVEVGSIEVLGILSGASSVIAEGEVLQLSTANNTATGEATYLEVIRAKTAKLFSAAAEIAPVIAERPVAERAALASYGMNLGIAFQLVDDALDYGGSSARLGKAVGDDFREGKVTLPVILAFLRGDEEERGFWKRCLERLDQTPADLDAALELLRRHGALADTLERARHYGAMARDALGLFADGPVKRALLEAVDFAIERGH